MISHKDGFGSAEHEKPLRILLRCVTGNISEKGERSYPLGLLILVAAARKQLPDYELDFRVEFKSSLFFKSLQTFKPHLVGISSVSMYWSKAVAEGNIAHDLGIPVIFGGIHISLLPKSLPRYAIAACIGEGEVTFPEMIRGFIVDKLTESRKQIKGLAYWEEDRLVTTEAQPLLDNLDDSPFPAYDCLPQSWIETLITSRGCPYDCIFCSTTRYWKQLRLHSAERVIADASHIITARKPKLLIFSDDLFVASKRRLLAIAEGFKKKGILGSVPMSCSARANLIDDEVAEVLKHIGIVNVAFGFESGDVETLRYLKGTNVTVEDNYRAIDIMHRHNIKVHGFFIIGAPFETKEQIQNTFALAKRTDTFDFSFLTPYPGTPLWELAKNKGMVRDNMPDWSILDRSALAHPEDVIMLSEKMRRNELLDINRKLRRLRFFHNAVHMIGHPLLPAALSQFWNIVKTMMKYKTF